MSKAVLSAGQVQSLRTSIQRGNGFSFDIPDTTTGGLAAETAARIAADAALAAAIAAEIAARIYNETLLQNQITSNVILLGDAVTIPADYNIIVAGPMTIAGTLTVSGYFGSVY